jgi:hypothetical protein
MNCNKLLQVFLPVLMITAMILAFPLSPAALESEAQIEHEAGFYYTIQKGDTLWDLSSRFFDSPWVWPELWRENQQIPNPHWIYPGERIRLFQQRGKDSFVLKLPEAKTTPAAAQTEMGPIVTEEAPYFQYTLIDRVGFIRKAPIKPVGVIFKVEDDKRMISAGDLVYVRSVDEENDLLLPGSRYVIYRTVDPTEDKQINRRYGKQYYMLGVAEVIKKGTGFVLAKVIDSFYTIQIDDLLMPYKRRSPKITLNPSVPGLKGTIIAAEHHNRIIGDYTVVFVDKGSQDQVEPGQSYLVFYQEKQRINPDAKEEILLPPVEYGTFIILHTELETATAMVIKADSNLSPGDTFYAPQE